MDITYIRLQKLISSYKTARSQRQTQEIELWTRVRHITYYTAKPFDVSIHTFFKYIIVYNYIRTSKQKFPFVSEAKEGYLSTQTMSYSCMDIARLCHTKSLTKVVPSYEVAGFHITAPFLPDHSHGKQRQLNRLKILCSLARSEVYCTVQYGSIPLLFAWSGSRCCPHLLSASVHIFADSPHQSTFCLHVSTLCPQVKEIFLVGKIIACYYIN
jgi:hypothetical protein